MARRRSPLGESLRQLRRSRGWTQIDLADEIGCTQASVSEYERGRVVPPLTVLRRVLEALEADEDERGLVSSIALGGA